MTTGEWEPKAIGRDMPAYAAVAEEIRSAIIRGDLSEGMRLPTEADMAERFKVSRGTIREALRTLASMNLIETTRGVQGGSFVTKPSSEQLIRHMRASLKLLAADRGFTLESTIEARKMLEVPALELVIERATDDELHEIAASVHRRTSVGVLSPNQSFHVRLARATRNPMIETMLYAAFEVQNVRMEGMTVQQEILEHYEEEHQELAEALLRRDLAASQRLMESHFATVERFYVQVDTDEAVGRRRRRRPATARSRRRDR
jgi:DNA-binding FadR family transcriptional regulator